jgi:hypothetical protein
MADEAFRTDDMTLVAVLTMHRFRYRIEVVQGHGGRKRANWLYTQEASCSEEFKRVVGEYLGNKLRIEPQSFVRTLAKVRGDMYQQIGPPNRSEPDSPDLRVASSA